MSTRHDIPRLPASFFGIVLGLAGLANAWRAAHAAWSLPAFVGETLTTLALFAWLVISALYATKWIIAPREARAEAEHAVQCCFIGLGGVATLLVAQGVLPYARPLALVLFVLGAAFTLAFALWRTGFLWRGEREAGSTTPVLYLPSVAGGFVTGTTAAMFGASDWGQLAFGAALFSWLAIESVLLHRLYTGPALPPPLRPVLGIQLAPPAVGAVAYLTVAGGTPDVFAHALLGYGLLQALLLARMMPWIAEAGFAPSYWAFTFGATALAAAAIRMVEHGDHGAVAQLAPWLFGAANLVVIVIAVGTVRLALQGKLLPRMPSVSPQAGRPPA
ncbi:dicarboxylate transporter/tellurite-resistance protein TehA [Aureimonas sp. SK2]|uniref:dicarboxylate transporter/tellurite-resistance protein TehA n=1 Tax=Aureimonas sp. SK2 TaxID=3015992 RepID=UPI002444B4B8|nr:dicarboxylate transporter/tellurite-resistance protein TehA [Aureimonas sp. SK2]